MPLLIAFVHSLTLLRPLRQALGRICYCRISRCHCGGNIRRCDERYLRMVLLLSCSDAVGHHWHILSTLGRRGTGCCFGVCEGGKEEAASSLSELCRIVSLSSLSPQNFASYSWGKGPLYIADYACQGAYIAEKILCFGTQPDFIVIAFWQACPPLCFHLLLSCRRLSLSLSLPSRPMRALLDTLCSSWRHTWTVAGCGLSLPAHLVDCGRLRTQNFTRKCRAHGKVARRCIPPTLILRGVRVCMVHRLVCRVS